MPKHDVEGPAVLEFQAQTGNQPVQGMGEPQPEKLGGAITQVPAQPGSKMHVGGLCINTFVRGEGIIPVVQEKDRPQPSQPVVDLPWFNPGEAGPDNRSD